MIVGKPNAALAAEHCWRNRRREVRAADMAKASTWVPGQFFLLAALINDTRNQPNRYKIKSFV